MVVNKALWLIPKERIDDFARIECLTFGNILLQAMGYPGSCAGFTLCEDGRYNILELDLDDGDVHEYQFSYEDIHSLLTGKNLVLTTTVTGWGRETIEL